MSTIYASFIDATKAEQAAGALLDQGAAADDLSIVANELNPSSTAVASDAEHAAKSGITTTTGDDAAVGAAKGAGIGLGVGVLAAIASVFVPGVGLILGGGALATALAGGGATILAGTATGAVVGFLRDQGIPEEMATHYSSRFVQGGAILAIAIPSGKLSGGEIEGILAKYGAENIATYNSSKVLIDNPSTESPKVPLVVDNPNIDPIAVTPTRAVVDPIAVTRVVDASTGESQFVTTGGPTTVVDTVTGRVLPTDGPVVIDPLTGMERPATLDEVLSDEACEPVHRSATLQ